MINDAASFSVMIESIGCHTSRWMILKLEEFLMLEAARVSKLVPRFTKSKERRLHHVMSSLSSSSNSSNHTSSCTGKEGAPPRKMTKTKVAPRAGNMIGPHQHESSGKLSANGDSEHKVCPSSGRDRGKSDFRSKRNNASQQF